MPVIVSDLIHSSMRLIGAIAAGETLETNELNDAFISLNQMLSSWSTEGASLVGRKRTLIPLNSSVNSYLLNERPVRIEAASVSVSNGVMDSPLQIVDSVGWEAVPEKQAQSVYTKVLYCDYAYPNATVYIAPLPRLGGTLELWMYAVIAQFATVNDVIDLPPGYEIALRYNFAIALLPEYPRSQVDPTLPAQAQNYKASIVQLNSQNHMRSQMPSPTQSAIADAVQTISR
jgi:hypothetical protein